MEIWPVFGLRFRPLPVTFWNRSKNKSCSTLCADHVDISFARRFGDFSIAEISLGTTCCRCVWRHVGHYLAGPRLLKYSSCRPEHDVGGLLGAHWLRVRRNSEVKRVGGWSNPRMGDHPGKLLRELPKTKPCGLCADEDVGSLKGVDCEIPHRPNGEGVMCLIWHTSHPSSRRHFGSSLASGS
ncbi:hypothetical protein L3X38_022812 [Prunus dulcis]|uniref:Uncharacterized protein n=1 Tax=Prunus dulcis TaxID=3755 RepID=A0AAD4VXT7_PRUDU|nr:hypothetical protein L3X38_022812 [Prunus dulcis]